MKRSKFTEPQIAFICARPRKARRLRGVRQAGTATLTYYNWRKKYDGLE